MPMPGQINMSPAGWNYPGISTPPQSSAMWGAQPMQQVQQPSYFQQPSGPSTQSPAPQSPFVGRYIDDISNVVPNEVPMDGRIGLYPTKDLSSIYLKSWNSEGRIMTFRYILDQSQNLNAVPVQEDPVQSDILKRLDQLEKQVATSAKKANQRTTAKGEEEK